MFFDTNKLAYCASFMDGEGYIEWTIREKKNGKGKNHRTHIYRMEICNTDKDYIKSGKVILEDFKADFIFKNVNFSY